MLQGLGFDGQCLPKRDFGHELGRPWMKGVRSDEMGYQRVWLYQRQ
ncbi:Hypothetical protein DEACI_2393 [Acididesulfobacillus acetoxydans]|uniref:Uncharacterized protein n=1 Tax=Acididesulfobacillus acetoxydans TaxID=1561005 RepID=A0A8S0Y372_9FIRM|nr:Hypothetical protein DEACI_2393 [Acididesulfobacillus acetoxydans]CEJ09056.1 Hypothetical protein DEACI_3539 [Acididesulfobacillus acetoxydans]